MRIDKWLWAARFFKSRSIASGACELGRVDSNGVSARPSREIRVGDQVRVKTEGGEFLVDVLALSETRGPAAVAQTLYRETDASREARLRIAAERKAMGHIEGTREGPPTKRDRRKLDRLRGRS